MTLKLADTFAWISSALDRKPDSFRKKNLLSLRLTKSLSRSASDYTKTNHYNRVEEDEDVFAPQAVVARASGAATTLKPWRSRAVTIGSRTPTPSVRQRRRVDTLGDGDRRERGADDDGRREEGRGGRVEVGDRVESVRAPGDAQRRVGRQSDDERRRQQHAARHRSDADERHDARPRHVADTRRLQRVRAAVADEREEVGQCDDAGGRVDRKSTPPPRADVGSMINVAVELGQHLGY